MDEKISTEQRKRMADALIGSQSEAQAVIASLMAEPRAQRATKPRVGKRKRAKAKLYSIPKDRITLSIDEAITLSGLCRSTINAEMKAGRLKSVKPAGRRLIFRNDLTAFLKGDAVVKSEARKTAITKPVLELVPKVVSGPAEVDAPKPESAKREIFGELVCSKFQNIEVRAIHCADEELWFVAKDVCDGLELENVTKALYGLDDDEIADLTISEVSSNGVTQRRKVNVISESGFYHLSAQSRKPSAKAFWKWVTRDLLPRLRKTGSYGNAAPLDETPERLMARALEQAAKTLAAKDAVIVAKDNRLKIVEPKAAVAERIAESEGELCFRHTANAIKERGLSIDGRPITQTSLIEWLLKKGWIYRDAKGHLRAYGSVCDKGYMREVPHIFQDKESGADRCEYQAKIIPKGLARIVALLNVGGGLFDA